MTDPRISALLGRAEPWWLWTLDGQQMVLTNEAGARALGATGIGIALQRNYSPDHAFAGQIGRIAAQLPESGEMRLERLREFGRANSAVLLVQARRLTLGETQLVLLTTAPSGANKPIDAALSVVNAVSLPAILYSENGDVVGANQAACAIASIPFDQLIGAAAAAVRDSLGRDGRAAIDLVTGAFSVSYVIEKELILGTFSTQPAIEEPLAGLRLVGGSAETAHTEPVPDVSAATIAVEAKPAVPRFAPIRRFLWRTDAGGLHREEPQGLAALLDQPEFAFTGESWATIAAAFAAELPESLVDAQNRRDVWSGIDLVLPRPARDTAIRLTLSGVPALQAGVFDGFRGFAIATEVANPAAVAVEATEAAALTDPEPIQSATTDETPETGAMLTEETLPEPEGAEAAGQEETPVRPTLTVHEKPANVFALRNSGDIRRGLSPLERHAFREIAKALNARVEGDDLVPPAQAEAQNAAETTQPVEPSDAAVPPSSHDMAERNAAETEPTTEAGTPFGPIPAAFVPQQQNTVTAEPVTLVPNDLQPAEATMTGDDLSGVTGSNGADSIFSATETGTGEPHSLPADGLPADGKSVLGLLDSVQLGLLVHRGNAVLFANKPLLDWTGYRDMQELEEAGGPARLFAEEQSFADDDYQERPDAIMIVDREGRPIPVAARLARIPWEGDTALMFALRRVETTSRMVMPDDDGHSIAETTLADVKSRLDEVEGILDTATDGIVIVAPNGQIDSLNRSAEALFGYESGEVKSRNFVTLFAPESHGVAQDYLEGLTSNGVASILNDGREIVGRVKQGGLIPLYMTLGRIGSSDRPKFAAVFRDMTQWKKAEEELLTARREAEKASSHKSDFLAKISHEIRTPLNAIIGFSEVMMEERFGPIGNQRYKDYLRDIHLSGGHVLSLINDLLDLSKIEAGKLELNFISVDLNAVVQQCVAIMQPQVNREKVIIRSSLAQHLPNVVADDRSIRQVVLNLLSNSVKFTPPGGQVIISTAFSEQGEAVIRVRDTGVGMTEDEIKVALEPFRQIATSQTGQAKGTGLGLPLTKALVEANRASFGISSRPGQGTIIEIVFPATRVLAE